MPTPAVNPARDAIFISYRRDDARGASGRLYDWLRIAFGREKVFRDVASIGVGRWRDKIDGALAQSAVCVAVVGQRWANAENLLRLHDSGDMVRHELLSALADTAMTLVPTLVEDAAVPSAGQLPAELRPLFDTWNARPITENGWEDDTRRLIDEIADATRLPVVAMLDELLLAQQRLAAQEQQRHLQAGQIEALNRTVEELRTKLAEAPTAERAGLAAAFTALARGESLQAENAFEREYEAQTLAETQARQTRAEAARNVANLALLRDVDKAARFYRHAMAADPQDAETARLLGHALITLGDLVAAQAAMGESWRLARIHQNSWSEMAAQGGIGDIAKLMGDLPAARGAYGSARQLAEHRLASEPANAGLQRDLSVSHNRIGDVLAAQGDGPAALDAFRKGMAIRQTLAARDPANAEWQRDLSVSHDKIGNMLAAQGDGPAALDAFRKSMAIRQALAARDPANTEWQRDLSVSHDKIGDVLAAQGDGPAALDAFRKSMAIRQALAVRDPANTEWQRDLSVSHGKIGDVLAAQGDGPAALDAFRKGMAIRQALAARDPANTEWQRDLSVSHNRIGNMLAAQGDGPAALDAFRKSMAIAEALAARDPANAQWAVDLAVSYAKLGTRERALAPAERRRYLEQGAYLLHALKAAGRLMPNQDFTDWFATQLKSLPE